jgi:hypothetical protein
MKEGDISAYIDAQLQQFRLLGREDLATQVETAIALVAEGMCSAETCYDVFEAAKKEVLELQAQQVQSARRKQKKKQKQTTKKFSESPPPLDHDDDADAAVAAALGVDSEDGVVELLRQAKDKLYMRIFYHVLWVIENRTRALHPREKQTTWPRKELEHAARALELEELRRGKETDRPVDDLVTDDYALSQARNTTARKRTRRSKPAAAVSKQQPPPMSKLTVDKALLYQAILHGVQYSDEMRLPAHLLTNFEWLWIKANKR